MGELKSSLAMVEILKIGARYVRFFIRSDIWSENKTRPFSTWLGSSESNRLSYKQLF
jgi:hypothetical protein